MNNLLNPALYQQLQQHFGDVRVSRRGEHRQTKCSPSPSNARRLQTRVISKGEQYRINCCFCNDGHHRLYVSYMCGQLDPASGQPNWTLWYCHNETACHRSPQNQARFRVLTTLSAGGRVQPVAPVEMPEQSLSPELYSLPDNAVSVADLPTDHRAVVYLHSRNFHAAELARLWDVRYVPLLSPTRASNRILIPIFRFRHQFTGAPGDETVLVGWQARYVGMPESFTPKYMFPDDFQKSKVVYGLPQARQTTGPVYLCEGPTDVWRVGPGAVATFGLHVSREQLLLLVHHFPGRPVVILPDAGVVNVAHRTAQELRTARTFSGGDNRVVVAQLPTHRDDPGDCTPDEIWQAAAAALDQPVSSVIPLSNGVLP